MVRQILFTGAEGGRDYGVAIGTTAMGAAVGERLSSTQTPAKTSGNLLAKEQGRGKWVENYSLNLLWLL